jgi:hypothetical protein
LLSGLVSGTATTTHDSAELERARILFAWFSDDSATIPKQLFHLTPTNFAPARC